MIGTIIAEELSGQIFDLNLGQNLYVGPTDTEQAVEIHTAIYHGADHAPTKWANIQFSVKGYFPEDAEPLGNKILETVQTIMGERTKDGYLYNIMQCIPLNGPNYIKQGLYTANAEVHYTKE